MSSTQMGGSYMLPLGETVVNGEEDILVMSVQSGIWSLLSRLSIGRFYTLRHIECKKCPVLEVKDDR